MSSHVMNPFLHLYHHPGVDDNLQQNFSSIRSEKLFHAYPRHSSSPLPLSTRLTLSGQSLEHFSTRSPFPAPHFHPTLHRLTHNSFENTFKPREQAHMSPSTQLLWSNPNFTSQPSELNTPSTSLHTLSVPHPLPFINPPLKNPSISDPSTPILMAIQQKSPPSQPPNPVPSNPDIVVHIPQPGPDVVDPIEPSQQPTVVHNRLAKKYGCWMCHKSFDRPSSTFLFLESLSHTADN